jgi:hypothetical protein
MKTIQLNSYDSMKFALVLFFYLVCVLGQFSNLCTILLFSIPNTTEICEKMCGTYYVKPNLTLPEKSCLRAWILDLEFFINIFVLPKHTANKIRPVFFDI